MSKTIGVCIICKNEEVLIERMLASVKDADQIVVCDTGSTDRTLEILSKYSNVECYKDYIWDDDFSSAQNHAKSKMKTDWILSVDCDEYLDVPFDEVRRAVELSTQDTIAVKMVAEGGNRLEFMFSRLFKNSPDIYWCQRAHKHLNIPGAGEEVGNVRIVFGYSPAHQKDPDRTLRILEAVVRDEGDATGRNLYYLGREYWYKLKYKECTQTLGRYVVSTMEKGWPAERAEAFLVMSMAYSAQGLDEDARDSVLQAIKINPNFREAIEWMASIVPPEQAIQWRRMARTANNNDVLWDRVPAKPVHDVLFIEPHQDDFALFGAYTVMRYKPLIISVTSSFIQPNRGDVSCDAETRRKESIAAAKLVGCPIVFLDIPDTELTEETLRERLQYFNPETIYIPAFQGGNPQHDLVNKVAMELFGRNKCEQYSTYSKTQLYISEGYEIKPTPQEMELKNKMLDCYQSQINLPSTAPHFSEVRNRSEWLL